MEELKELTDIASQQPEAEPTEPQAPVQEQIAADADKRETLNN
jgi:hypothetical protein